MPQNILTYLTYSMIAALPLTISQWYIDNGAFMLIVLTLYLGDYLVGSFVAVASAILTLS